MVCIALMLPADSSPIVISSQNVALKYVSLGVGNTQIHIDLNVSGPNFFIKSKLAVPKHHLQGAF